MVSVHTMPPSTVGVHTMPAEAENASRHESASKIKVVFVMWVTFLGKLVVGFYRCPPKLASLIFYARHRS